MDRRQLWHEGHAEASSSHLPEQRKATQNNPEDGFHGSRNGAPVSNDEYTIAWICALHLEIVAARAMLDEIHEDVPEHPNDKNIYILGGIQGHNIVIVGLLNGLYEMNSKASMLTHLIQTFPSIRLGLLVGIGGGVPGKVDMRLGDIVVGTRVVQYDLGRIIRDGQIQRNTILKEPHHLLGTAISSLQDISRIPLILEEKFGEDSQYCRPTIEDRLFFSTYEHPPSSPSCDECDRSKLVPRSKRSTENPVIHYGTIASGNRVIKNGTARDDIAQVLDAICFEMEAADLIDILPCLVIRGICDYSDSHKNREWQRYAAATAAAYTRELVAVSLIADVPDPYKPNSVLDDSDIQFLKDLCGTDPREDKTRIEATNGGLLRDSYRWILDHEDFQRWRDNPQSQMLWIKGDPGKGKTMLLCGIIDELWKDPGNRLSYFFCQATEARLNDATAVLRGLIYLLVDQHPSLISYVRKNHDHAGKQPLEDGNAWEALSKILADMLNGPILDGAILIIDALDECKTDRHQLLDFITKPFPVKWIVSSRNYPDIEETLDKVKHKVKLNLELNKDSLSKAVDTYIRHKVGQLALKKRYDKQTSQAVEDHLTSNANGTFLWVALICQELADPNIRTRHTLNRLKSFSPGLDSLYGREIRGKYYTPLSWTRVEEVDEAGYTPLTRASSKGHDAMARLRVEHGRTEKMAAVPPTDSGYASTSAVNHGFDGETNIDDQATLPSLQESPDECIDDTATIYSDASSTTFSRRECYISELADQLAKETQPLDVNQETLTRVSKVLPELLRAFALKIGHKAPSQMHRDFMAFVHKSRREIAAAFVDIGFSPEKDIIKVDATSRDPAGWKRRISDWLERENGTSANHADLANAQNVTEPPKATEGSNETKEGEDVTEFWLHDYRKFILQTPAFSWLLARLRNEFCLAPMKPNAMEAISQGIISALPSSHRISKMTSSQSYHATFELEWDIFEFFESQGYSGRPHEVFKGVITLTGSSSDAQATTCSQYLDQTWPSTAEDMVALIEGVLEENRSDPLQRQLSDGTTLQVCVRNSKFLAEANGVAATIAEIGEQLAWLGAALRTSPQQSGLAYCTPTIISILQSGPPSSRFEPPSRSTGIACKIGFPRERIPETLTINGQCWQAVFRNPVIVRGYPIPQRSEWNIGLEIPLDIMAGLARAQQVHEFNDKVCVKGFSTMLVPIRRIGNMLCWHLLYKKDGSRISYLDNDLDQEEYVGRLDLRENIRHVLGWCSRATLVAGSNQSGYPTIAHSMLPKPGPNGALTKRSVKRGRTLAGGSTFHLGAKESPEQLFSNEYIRRLQFMETRFVLLWDEDEKRGWLVSGINALLHALRIVLAHASQDGCQSAFAFESEDFQESDKPLTAMSALEMLTNEDNQKLPVYREGNDYTRLKSKIEDLCSVFEHLIDHQTDIAGECGIKLSKKPRCDLEGWDFEDLVKNYGTLHPRVATLEPHGKGWVDFTRAIQAVTLVGRGFGDIIKPSVETCSRWASLPKGRYYIAACLSDLRKVFKEHGFCPDGHIRLSDNLIWHTPTAKSEFCQCSKRSPGSGQDHCEPVQTVFPLALSGILSPRGNKLPDDGGALIFGHSSEFSWIWDDLGHPREGHLSEPASSRSAEEASNSPKDSGIGSSLRSSESEGRGASRYSESHYTVGILCAKPEELQAVWALFDEVHDSPRAPNHQYVFGRMGHHMVVATCLSKYGTIEAALAASKMEHRFILQFCLLVGIGGGVPSEKNDIRLGDVVVGNDVVQYDLGQNMGKNVFRRKEHSLRSPPHFLMTTISTKIRADPYRPDNPLGPHLEKISSMPNMSGSFCHQGAAQDVLFEPCSECQSLEKPCPQRDQHVRQRAPRPTLEPQVHYGRIASGNQVIKDAVSRDQVAGDLNAMCFEMEAAGVVSVVPCLVIRGISDYCDIHKNDVWQKYAAATAAAYAKLLLTVVDKQNTDDDSRRPSESAYTPLAGTKRRWCQYVEK